MNIISPNLNIMIKACEKASKILIRDFGEIENLQVSKKGPKDFVTNADKKVEQALIKELSKKKYSIISEEAGAITKEDNNNFWIIDPIDGTTNFLNGVPHFCISIALFYEKEIIAGAIPPAAHIVTRPNCASLLSSSSTIVLTRIDPVAPIG